MSTQKQRQRRLLIIGGVLLAAVVAVAVVIGVSSGGSSTTTTGTKSAGGAAKPASKATAESAVESEFAGIPQKGNILGSPTAKATLMVFADMQCPFCAQFENNALPALVKRYVKTGKLKVVFQPIAILGNDSVLGARASSAAALQNKMFQFNAQLYRNQGQENTGYMTTGFLKKIAADAGLDAAKLTADTASPRSEPILASAQSLATSGHVDSTPSFFVAKKGQPLQALQISELKAAAFYGKLDQITR